MDLKSSSDTPTLDITILDDLELKLIKNEETKN